MTEGECEQPTLPIHGDIGYNHAIGAGGESSAMTHQDQSEQHLIDELRQRIAEFRQPRNLVQVKGSSRCSFMCEITRSTAAW